MPDTRTTEKPIITPAVDVYENDNEILVVADMPGARSESISVTLDKEELSLAASRDGEADGQRIFGATSQGEYRRTFVVPPGVDANAITAELTAGVLKVRLPKAAAVKPRVIEVKAVN